MKTLLIGLMGLIGGFVIVTALGAATIMLFSNNTHDLNLEAGMTAFFFFGPIGAIVGLIAGLIWARAKNN